MNVSTMILVGATGTGLGFLLGFWVGLLVRPKNEAAVTPPVMSRREVQDLRATALALEAKVEKLEHQMKVPSLPRNQAR